MLLKIWLVDSWLGLFERFFLFAALAFMSLVVFFDFFLREFLDSGLIWAKEVSAYLMIWVGFVGGSLATQNFQHLVVGIPPTLLPPKVARSMGTAATLLAAASAFFLTWITWAFVNETREFGDISLSLEIPLWKVQIIMPIALFIIGLRFLDLAWQVGSGGVPQLGGEKGDLSKFNAKTNFRDKDVP